MEKITFNSGDVLMADQLNQLQTNVENAIPEQPHLYAHHIKIINTYEESAAKLIGGIPIVVETIISTEAEPMTDSAFENYLKNNFQASFLCSGAVNYNDNTYRTQFQLGYGTI